MYLSKNFLCSKRSKMYEVCLKSIRPLFLLCEPETIARWNFAQWWTTPLCACVNFFSTIQCVTSGLSHATWSGPQGTVGLRILSKWLNELSINIISDVFRTTPSPFHFRQIDYCPKNSMKKHLLLESAWLAWNPHIMLFKIVSRPIRPQAVDKSYSDPPEIFTTV